MLRQKLGRALAHEADPEAINHALQRQLLRVLDLAQNVFAPISSPCARGRQLLFSEIVNIGHALHQAGVNQLVHQHVAHALDIHHAARSEVPHASLNFAGQLAFTQRWSASPSARTTWPPHSGHFVGM